jgi:ketosteroid isomerase-like protein
MSTGIEQRSCVGFFAAIETGDLSVFDEIVAQEYDDRLAGQSPWTRDPEAVLHRASRRVSESEPANFGHGGEGRLCGRPNRARGTHKGNFSGLTATGKPVDAAAFQLYRIQNGQLAEHWELADYATIM